MTRWSDGMAEGVRGGLAAGPSSGSGVVPRPGRVMNGRKLSAEAGRDDDRSSLSPKHRLSTR